MRKISLILAILILKSTIGFTQSERLKFDSMRCSLFGDSLIPQQYELIIKKKKINFITPVASYLHVEGAKYRTRAKLDKFK